MHSISLGCWHNFGGAGTDSKRLDESAMHENCRRMLFTAFDHGITHFDLANNYGPPPGAAEAIFGQVMTQELMAHRDEIIVSTKAGYDMWPGPYGNYGSRKHLLASVDQSLQRMNLPYVDIFYHHRPDPATPLEETMSALDYIVRSGRALYVGLSNYDVEQTTSALALLRDLKTPCLVHQPSYSMLNREPEAGLFQLLSEEGIGAVAYSPLAQGRLTGRYLDGIPKDSRAARPGPFLTVNDIVQTLRQGLRGLDTVARRRGQSLPQLALAWVLRQPVVTSAVVGASRPSQLDDVVQGLRNLSFTAEELSEIDQILAHMN